jgi:hypothetical protein
MHPAFCFLRSCDVLLEIICNDGFSIRKERVGTAFLNVALAKLLSKSGDFSLYLLKGHILMAEIFAGRIHVLHSKVCILLQDMRADVSLHKHMYDIFIILLIYGL